MYWIIMRCWLVSVLSLLFLAAFFISQPLYAQPVEYKTGLGLKLGSPCAVSAKFMTSSHQAVELLAGGWLHAGGATILYEYHIYMRNAPSLRWYLGGGAHCAYAAKNNYNPYADVSSRSGVYAGVDAILGLEYVFRNAPFSVSLDALPLINLTEGATVWWNAGISFRYTFR